MTSSHPSESDQSYPFRPLFVGTDTHVPLLDGSWRHYINLDNAASTPALKAVQQAINDFLPYIIWSEWATHSVSSAICQIALNASGQPE